MATPVAFLCHASEDKATAERIATDLTASGIETFFDNWEIRAGDSLRQKIDQGLGRCTHFLALLSAVSIRKPWVNAELDAGFMRRINSQATLIPIRLGLKARDLPPLLSGLLSPSIDDYATGIKTLIEDIHGVTKKPPIGAPPRAHSSSWARKTGLSVGAARIAEAFVMRSKNGRDGDPAITVDELRELTGYSDQQLIDAIDELEEGRLASPSRVIGAAPFGYHVVTPTGSLFIRTDPAIMGWNPIADAKTVAVTLVNEFPNGSQTLEIADRLGWTARRLNPALTVLCSRDLVMASRNIDATFVTASISPTARTRRFARE